MFFDVLGFVACALIGAALGTYLRALRIEREFRQRMKRGGIPDEWLEAEREAERESWPFPTRGERRER